MNAAHLHIILNHIPVIGIPFGTALLIYGFLRKSQEVKTVGFIVFVAIALVTVPTFLAGKAAEDMVEPLPGVSEHLIENHERAATIALAVTSVLGALSLLRLLAPARFATIGATLTPVVFVFSLGVSGWLARTANLGGQIRHSEIRESGASVGEDREDEDAGERDERANGGIREQAGDERQEQRQRGRGRGRRGKDR